MAPAHSSLTVLLALAVSGAFMVSATLAAYTFCAAARHLSGTRLAEVRPAFLYALKWASLALSLVHIVCGAVAVVAGAFAGIPVFAPVIGWLALVYFAQGYVEYAIERDIRSVEVSYLEHAAAAVRGLAIGLGVYVVYFLIYRLTLTGFDFAGAGLGLSPGWRAAALWGGVPAGVFLGVGFLYLVSPAIVRLLFPSSPARDSSLSETVAACFRKAGLSPPAVWLMDLDRYRAHNAMVAGLEMGRGRFRQSLFLTRSLPGELTKAELEAVILHEASHVALHHMQKRLVVSVLAVLVALIPYLFLMTVIAVFLPRSLLIAGFAGTLVVFLVVQVALIRAFVRRQEIQADAHAVFKLGAEADHLASALRKITRLNEQLEDRKDPHSILNPAGAHPTVTQRIELLRKGHHERIRAAEGGKRPVWATILAGPGGLMNQAALLAGLIATVACWDALKDRYLLRRHCERGNAKIVERLVAKGAPVNGRDVFALGKTPLVAASESGNLEVVRLLLKAGADPDRAMSLGFTPLMAAAANGRMGVVRALASSGADPGRESFLGDRPADLAGRYGHHDVARYLRAVQARRIDPASTRAHAPASVER